MIILLSGWRKSGKDTSADYLVQHYAMKKLSFAKALKDHVCDKYKLTEEDVNDQRYKEQRLMSLPIKGGDEFAKSIYKSLWSELAPSYDEDDTNEAYWTPRALCILEGNIARTVNPNHWVDTIAKEINYKDTFIISDFRFPNEYDRLEELFGRDEIITVRINRFETINTVHDSEHQLDNFPFDFTINNKSDIVSLYSELDKLVNNIFKDNQNG